MDFPGPPPGWMLLQERMQRAKTAKEINDIAHQMERLLRAYEQTVGNMYFPESEDVRGSWRQHKH